MAAHSRFLGETGAALRQPTSPRLVADHHPFGDRLRDLLDIAEAKGRWDVIADLGYPLPATVIADLLGVPRADVEHLKRWSDDLGAFVLTSRLDEGRHDRAAAAIGEMEAYFAELVRHRRAARRDDLVSGLVAAEEAGDFLSVEELVAASVLLLFAGHETTTHLVGNGLLALIQHPEQMAALRQGMGDEVAVRNAVEEMLRFDGPILSVTRNIIEDIEVGGQSLRAGERLFFLLAAAGRDPAVFPNPHHFDIARAEAGRHVNFAYGIHFCLGAPLARLEGEVVFPRLLRRFPEFALAEPGPEWSDSLVIRGLNRLPVVTG